uniref:Uncharacterized protein n=1 Tax=viral metagenome TaxID=1070528 RepID=A0A6C0I6R2_9ZZZZ
MDNTIIKRDSYSKYEKKILYTTLDILGNMNKQTDTLNNNTIRKVQDPVNIKYIKDSVYDHQDLILDILLELRYYDETNGTKLFKNLNYKNLNTFILKNNS